MSSFEIFLAAQNPSFADWIHESLSISEASDVGSWLVWIALRVVFGIAAICVVMCFAALSVVIERKVAAFIQGRYGPDTTCIPYVMLVPVVGKVLQKCGLFQLAADGLKFLFKEDVLPAHTKKFWYMLAPALSLAPVLILACVIPFGVFWYDGVPHALAAADFNLSLLFVLVLGSLGVYGSVLAGWASNNKFSYLASVRSAAQMVSYELSMVLALIPVIIWIAPRVQNPLSLFDISMCQQGMWNLITHPLSAFLFLMAIFAETNRQPFDMAESETDLVSGYHTEYSSFKFGLFYVGEYGHLVVGSSVFICLFLGAWSPFPGLSWAGILGENNLGFLCGLLSFLTFIIKILAMVFTFVWIRWTLPRFRYDHVMNLGWSRFLPLAILNLAFYLILACFVK